MNFLRPDSSFMMTAYRIVYMLYAHLLMVICCIPVITVGASVTAMHFVLYKISKDEEGNVTKTFFRSFKENFKHGTILWLIYFFAASLLAFDIYFVLHENQPLIMIVIMFALGIVLLASMSWGFVLLSRYNNSALKTLRYSFAVSLAHPGSTLVMMTLSFAPGLLALEYFGALPIFLVLGAGLSGYHQPRVYGAIFEKIEAADSAAQTNNEAEEEGE